MTKQKQKVLDYWRESARENLIVALDNYEMKHYDWCLFFWHLVLEKTLKGNIVSKSRTPVATHDLVKLTRFLEIKLTELEEKDLKEINTFNLSARYDDYKKSFYKKATKKYADKWIKICQHFYEKWLKNN
ncbi:MAG: HEPN domain-containing protein [Patescibacteria group bacterium]|nr:HEPN domain-containing protein [Patescibacteria group bacterium]